MCEDSVFDRLHWITQEILCYGVVGSLDQSQSVQSHDTIEEHISIDSLFAAESFKGVAV